MYGVVTARLGSCISRKLHCPSTRLWLEHIPWCGVKLAPVNVSQYGTVSLSPGLRPQTTNLKFMRYYQTPN
ncbi:hypothetical protein AYI69_g2157 [Smittium culicis]|uniref:Uncharacterized protein n=1 Tax=Smittium culicis TaxID=133412 RepID=A0A1R1YNA8_9FUNG|nr:hypothetical protein AYI69_g2157 [Smittium culicis]